VFSHPSFTVEPWRVTETTLDLGVLAQTESIFALSNGHLGLRGNLDEGEPYGLPGTYLNSVYELRPLPYAEAGYGYPESGQTIVNVTNGKLIRLLVDDEPLDVRYGDLLSHRRCLDLRAGHLTRELEWRSPAGTRVRVRSVRLVSFVQRSVAAVRYEVEALDRPAGVVLQSELVANESVPALSGDPRVAAALDAPLEGEENLALEEGALLIHRVRASGLRVAAAMQHTVEAGSAVEVSAESISDVARTTVVGRLAPGETLTVTKLLAYGWSAQRSRPAVHDQVRGAIQAAAHTGWDGLVEEQRAYLDDFWDRADIELDGDPETQQGVRFAMFHVLQAGARAERRPIPAKGLTGPGYDGHAFWDTEIYVLGLLTMANPAAVADALRWRHRSLPAARERARQLGLAGAAFPWRTINGQECSSYWPAGTAAFHIGADVAYAVVRYLRATEDREFEHEAGLELLVETSRLWLSLGHRDGLGRFRIDGVTGPDEYSAVADNNVYTNLMAQLNLRAAAVSAGRHREHARELGVTDEEMAAWRGASDATYIPSDERLDVHPQADGFTDHQVWDFASTPPDHYPLLLHYPYFDLYRKQVLKQADLVLALHLRGDAFTAEEKGRDFDYYEALTVRDSSLSACTQAVMAAEVGHLELAYRYLREAVLMDLADLEHNTADGVHIASLAGAWIALVDGFGGMRLTDEGLSFRPCLPPAIGRLCFHVAYRSRRLRVTVDRGGVTYRLLQGTPLGFSHYGEVVEVREGQELARAIPEPVARPAPSQPAGREPVR
jgi:alpha,alpha-trehalose phosphorylase